MDSGGAFDAINEKLRSGDVSCEALAGQVRTMLEVAYKKPAEQIDVPLVEALEGLLTKLCGSAPTDADLQKSKKGALAKLEKRNRNRRRVVRSAVAGGIAVASFFIAIVGNNVLHRTQLSGTSTVDEQQYVVGGSVVDAGLVREGNADPVPEDRELKTKDYGEMAALLGYAPGMPQWLPEGWALSRYAVKLGAFEDVIVAFYQKSGEKSSLIYHQKTLHEVDLPHGDPEMNPSETILDINGKSTRFSQAADRSIAAWRVDATTFMLYGPVTQEDLVRILQSFTEDRR